MLKNRNNISKFDSSKIYMHWHTQVYTTLSYIYHKSLFMYKIDIFRAVGVFFWKKNHLYYLCVCAWSLHFGTRAYLFSPDEGSCYIFSIRNNCCEFLASYGVIFQVIFNHIAKYINCVPNIPLLNQWCYKFRNIHQKQKV